jgi:acetoin utilization protein AcuB
MIALNLINESIPTLKTSNTGLYALNLMDELKLSHLPIQNDLELLGVVSDTDIYSFNQPEEPIGNHNLSLSRPFVFKDQHIFDIIKQFSSLNLTLLPVLDEKEHYLGSITVTDLIHGLAEIAAVENPGGVIILDVNYNNYSLSEIAQIVESNDAKILNLCVTSSKDSTQLEITLKTNKININPILQTFNRYNYNVKATFAEKTNYEDMKERMDEFLNYLNI